MLSKNMPSTTQAPWPPTWPVLTTYDQQHLGRIALPLGGIGTGVVSLGGRGDLRDWEIVNRPAKGFKPAQTFFALYAKAEGKPAVARALEGMIDPHDYQGAFGSAVPNHGLPRFRQCQFEAAYPFGQVVLSDTEVPVNVRIQAFNPLVPADVDRSSMPVAVLRFVLTNKTNKPVTASVCGNLENFIGQDGSVVVDGRINSDTRGGAQNTNTYREGKGVRGLFMQTRNVPNEAEQWGTLALTTTSKRGLSHRTTWADLNWGDSLLDYWDDFSADGALDERESQLDNPIGSLAVKVTLPPKGTQEITFLLTWHFPNRLGWGSTKEPSQTYGVGVRETPYRVGNYYTTQYADAWDAAERTAAQLPKLEADTLKFVNAFIRSDLPDAVKEAALYNVSTLRSQTTFRIPSGHVLGWEGTGDKAGSCYGSCTHVWNYEQTTGFLFGELARTMREVEFKYSMHDDGLMAFRADLPLDLAVKGQYAAADGQMGCLMKLYRDWQLSGDDAMLRDLWPSAKRALEFCWLPGGWDADQDGVMEGCQHNTMDVEYYGPNPQMGTWYLGALRAMEEMARYLGEADFAAKCRDLFERGRAWTDTNLFNGEYYEHQIRPPKDDAEVAEIRPGLRVGMGALNLQEPDLQLGAGCLVDQLVGQYMAHVCGLGDLLDPEHVRTTLRSIMKHNFKHGFNQHFNHLRSFVLGDESALLMATYPKGRRPRRPFPYYNEVMTGFEYTAGIHMLYEGQDDLTQAGLQVIGAIRQRYDGLKRSPFDEAECGHHYARAMAAWAGVLALTGFHYSAITKTLTFAPLQDKKHATYFWSNGRAWGTCALRGTKKQTEVTIHVMGGEIEISKLVLTGYGEAKLKAPKRVKAGKIILFEIDAVK